MLKEGEKEMNEIIKKILDELFGIAFSGTVDSMKESKDQKKRIQEAESKLSQILESVKDEAYYDNLVQIISETRIIQDYFKRCITNKTGFGLSERVNSAFKNLHISIQDRNSIKAVLERMVESLKEIMFRPDSTEELRLSFQNKEIKEEIRSLRKEFEKSQEKVQECLSYRDIESYSDPVQNTTDLISRKWIKEESSKEEESEETPAELIQREKRIILINHAGFGKTKALYQIFNELKATGKCTVLLSLNRYPGLPLLHKILENNVFDQEQIALILDGYDEVQATLYRQLNNDINQISKLYPEMMIVISSRENFIEKDQLERFKRYRLANLNIKDWKLYAQNHQIDTEQFINQINEKNLMDISKNAFYFIELVRLWKRNGELPNEAKIMEKIIESRLRADQEKFKLSKPELEQREFVLLHIFERIAMIMQCTHRYSFTEKEVRRICLDEMYDQVSLHGIWESEDTLNLHFSHNNFREYFAACWLNRRPFCEILNYISADQKIKPSWMNTVAYLAKIRDSRDLQEWVCEHDPNVVSVFEKEHFSEEERYSLFSRIFDETEKRHIWLSIDYQSMRKLGTFVSSKRAVEYILNNISKDDVEERQMQNLFRIMESFDSLYEENENCKDIIGNIAFNENLSLYVRCDALRVMCAFPNVFFESVPTAAQICMKSEEEDYRYHLEHFIDASGKIEQFFQLIIHELEFPIFPEGTVNLSRHVFLEKKISALRSPQAISSLFSFLAEHSGYFADVGIKIDWEHILTVASMYEFDLQYDFLNKILRLFGVAQTHFSRKVSNEIKKYMIKTCTEEEFLKYILKNMKKSHQLFAIESIMCPSFSDILVSYYRKDKLPDPDLIRSIMCIYSQQDIQYQRLQQAIFHKTGECIVPCDPYAVENELRNKGKQYTFNTLFSSSCSDFVIVAEKLGANVGLETLLGGASFKISCEKADKQAEIEECNWILRDSFEGKNITILEAIEKIKACDWEWFRYCAIRNRIYENKTLYLNESQMAWIEKYTEEELKQIDLKEESELFFKEKKFRKYVKVVLSMMVKIDMNRSMTFVKSLLLVPSFLLDENDAYNFSDYILRHLSKDEMDKQVLKNIEQENLHECVAAAHIRYCEVNKLLGAKSFALHILNQKEEKDIHSFAIRYLAELYGTATIIHEVLPLCQTDEFLRTMVYYVPSDFVAPKLDEKLDDTYKCTPSKEWMEILIKRNHRNALEQYLCEAKKKNGIPDMTDGNQLPTITEAISSVSDSSLLDIILELLRLCVTPGFIDKESFELKRSCWNAICNMAQNDYVIVKDKLEQLNNESKDFNQICIDLIEKIGESRHIQLDVEMEFDEAFILTNT